MGNAGRVLMIPKGEYNSATTYEMLDFVYYQGRSYVCKQTSTGNVPTNTTYWQALTGDASAEIQALTNQLTDEETTRAALGAHNLLPFSMIAIKANNPSDASKTWDGNKYTYSSVEFTPVLDSNGDLLYINVNTTENTHAAAYFFIYGSNAQSQPNIFKGMKLSGCPSGSSSSTYSIVWQSYETQIVYPQHLSGSDVGAGTTISEDAYTRMYISIPANSVLDNVRFYPMIRLATDADSTYQPYAKTNVELTADKADKSDLASISITGTTNSTGSTIASGTYFYLNGQLVRAKTSIANGATLTKNTNYVEVPAGGLNSLIEKVVLDSTYMRNDATLNGDSYYYKIGNIVILKLDIKVPVQSTGNATVIIYGLPPVDGVLYYTLNNPNVKAEAYLESVSLLTRGSVSAQTVFRNTIVYTTT